LTDSYGQFVRHLGDVPTSPARHEARGPGAYPHVAASSALMQVGVVADSTVYGRDWKAGSQRCPRFVRRCDRTFPRDHGLDLVQSLVSRSTHPGLQFLDR